VPRAGWPWNMADGKSVCCNDDALADVDGGHDGDRDDQPGPGLGLNR